MIDQANATFGKAKEIVMAAYNQALADGFTPDEAKKLLLEKITVFKKSTLYACLPDESKEQTKPKKIPTLESAPVDFEKELELVRRNLIEVKKPYVIETTVEIRGQQIPLIVEVMPAKRGACVSIDEAKARRLGF